MRVPANAARRFLVARHFLAPARSLEGGVDAVREVVRRLARFSSTRSRSPDATTILYCTHVSRTTTPPGASAPTIEGRRLVTPDELAAYLTVALADDESAVTLGTRAPRGS
jgi:hypothetical protein